MVIGVLHVVLGGKLKLYKGSKGYYEGISYYRFMYTIIKP
jgi:hypothetical protein